VVKLDGKTVALYLLFVFFIAFLPFPTSILGKYPTSSMVVIFYALTITCASFTFFLMRSMAMKNGNLASETDPEHIGAMNRQSLVNCMMYLLSIPVAFVYPVASLLMWICAPAVNRVAIWAQQRIKTTPIED
jgi:uncharacterized membrane protein